VRLRPGVALAGAGAALLLAALIALFGLGFGWLAIQRTRDLPQHARTSVSPTRCLSWLRGQAFRLSTYQDAAFTTDIGPQCAEATGLLLAFHVEPMRRMLAPLYLSVGCPNAPGCAAVRLGAGRLATYLLAAAARSRLAGLAFALAYLLAPLGQWPCCPTSIRCLLADAAACSGWRCYSISGRRMPFVPTWAAGGRAKEEVGLAVPGLGFLALFQPRMRRARRQCPYARPGRSVVA